MLVRVVQSLCVVLLLCSMPSYCRAAYPWQKVVLRSTGDREHDLIQELIQLQRFDDAVAICRSELGGKDPQSDLAAKWAIRLSQIATRRQATLDHFDAKAVEEAQKPVSLLLRSYPDHTRVLFLRSQMAWVEKEAARHDVLIASISPPNEQRTDEVFKRLARITRHYEDLAKEVGQARSELFNRDTTLVEKVLAKDLERLEHELRADVVSMSLMQTNLFADQSRDQISSANQAEQDAEKALSVLPNNSRVRNEVDRMRVEAILRGGELDRAESELIGLVQGTNKPLPQKIQALIINLDVRRGRDSQAENRLRLFYGSNPDGAPRSIDMDLARLDYLISIKSRNVGSWLESIEKRNGAYARRRAEAISLSKLRSDGTSAMVDASIVAAQGKEWLRRNDPARAAKLLAAAARAERDPDRAIERATEAAAAYLKAGENATAANVLSTVASKNSTAKNAPAASLQAAVVLSSSKKPNAASEIEKLLIHIVDQWPTSEAGKKARQWLVLLMSRQERWMDLAKTATLFLKHDPSQLEIDQALSYWLELVEKLPSKRNQVIGDFQSAFAPLLGSAAITNRYSFAACFLLEANDMHLLPATLSPASDDERFADAFLRFRRDQTITPLLKSLPPNRKFIAIWRLMRDGHGAPAKRTAVAKLLQIWGGLSPVDSATQLVWSGQVKRAIDLITSEAKTSSQRSQLWKGLAKTLADTNKPDNVAEAIKIWDRLANGLPKASASWHEAKITAIDLLIRTGKVDDARRRAKYILLTNTPEDTELRRRYTAAANP